MQLLVYRFFKTLHIFWMRCVSNPISRLLFGKESWLVAIDMLKEGDIIFQDLKDRPWKYRVIGRIGLVSYFLAKKTLENWPDHPDPYHIP